MYEGSERQREKVEREIEREKVDREIERERKKESERQREKVERWQIDKLISVTIKLI